MKFEDLIQLVVEVQRQTQASAIKAVNVARTMRNWLIGAYINEFEFRGEDRAAYGTKLYPRLAARLATAQVPGCDKSRLYRYRDFYRLYPQIVATLSPLSGQLVVDRFSYSYYRRHEMSDGDHPPVGILLCTDKNHALVEYALAGMDNRLFVSKYQLELPKPEELQHYVEEQRKLVEEGEAKTVAQGQACCRHSQERNRLSTDEPRAGGELRVENLSGKKRRATGKSP